MTISVNLNNLCLGFAGLGLIGGSIAKTVKRISPSTRIIAYNRTHSVLEAARAEGIIDVVCNEINDNFKECDYIFLCMPVDYNSTYLNLISKHMKKNCIITDVGSVKTSIHETVIKLGLEDNFIGGHPMAGSEKTGYEAATDRLLENAYYLITPSATVSKTAIDNFYQFAKEIGTIPLILDYKKHDYYVSAISHAPHVIAASLVHLVKDSDNDEQIMKTIAAGGFKDTTRISASSPVMWQQICMNNSENVCKVLDRYIDVLKNAKTIFETKDADKIYDFLMKQENTEAHWDSKDKIHMNLILCTAILQMKQVRLQYLQHFLLQTRLVLKILELYITENLNRVFSMLNFIIHQSIRKL